MAKKKKRISRKISWPEAVQHHQAVFDFLHQGDLLGNLKDGLKPGKEEVIVSTLATSRRPVLIGKLAEATDVSRASVSLSRDSINECLSMFSTTQDVLAKGGIEIQIPGSGKSDETRFGYYLAFCDGHTGDVLTFSNSSDLKERVYIAYVRSMLRDKLKKEACEALSEKLGGRSDYQPLQLEAGFVREASKVDSVAPSRVAEHHRIWRRFSASSLLTTSERIILSSEAGTGKTTFLRYLQAKILQTTPLFAVFLHASEIATWGCKTLDSFVNSYVAWASLDAPAEVVASLIRHEIEEHVILLVDGLDQISGSGSDYEDLLEKLLKMFKKNIIIASRPTAVAHREEDTRLLFLRLQPFSIASQKAYFGSLYHRVFETVDCHRDLMTVPMLAHMVRLLFEVDKCVEINSRTSVYRVFMDHLFHKYKHEQLSVSEDDRQRARGLLQRISYEAMTRTQPYIQKIPLQFCSSLASNAGVTMDLLLKLGIAELMIDRSGGIDKHLSFTHQSFQEFLAAEWASLNDERSNYLLKNCWNPSLREIVKFLCGLSGESVIERIYPEQCYDPIFARLFLAAECAGEIKIHPSLESRILEDLERACEKGFLADDAFNALVRMKTTKSLDQAWILLNKKDEFGSSVVSPYSTDSDLLRTLFTPDRFWQTFAEADNNWFGWASQLLEAWVDQIDIVDPTIDELCRSVRDNDFTEITLCKLELFAAFLSEEHVEALFDVAIGLPEELRLTMVSLLSACSDKLTCERVLHVAGLLPTEACGSIIWQYLSLLSKCSDRLSHEGVVAVLELLRHEDENVVLVASSVIEDAAHLLQPGQRDNLFASLWDIAHGKVAMQLAYCLRDQLSKKQIGEVIARFHSGDARTRHRAGELLRGLSPRLSAAQVHDLIGYLHKQDFLEDVIGVVLTSSFRLTHNEATELLDKLFDEQPSVHRMILANIERFNEHVEPRHLERILDILAQSHRKHFIYDRRDRKSTTKFVEPPLMSKQDVRLLIQEDYREYYSLRAAALLAGKMNRGQFQDIVSLFTTSKLMISFGASVIADRVDMSAEDIGSALSQHLDTNDFRKILAEGLALDYSLLLRPYLYLLQPCQMETNEIRCLLQLLDNESLAGLIYEFLKEVHEQGLLPAG